MDSSRDKTSIKGSQTNVAESSQPLLETGELGQKGSVEKIEIESTISKGKESSSKKDVSESERRRLKALNCMDSFTVNMNLLDRDSAHINDHIHVAFEEVLAEPKSSQSFDQVWKFAFVLFSGTKYWVYRVVAAACAMPCGLFWGLVFSFLGVASVWIITPAMRTIDVIFHIVSRVWGGLVHVILDPIFQSASLMFGGRLKGGRSPSKDIA